MEDFRSPKRDGVGFISLAGSLDIPAKRGIGVDSLPFAPGDVTAGTENELQAIVIGRRSTFSSAPACQAGMTVRRSMNTCCWLTRAPDAVRSTRVTRLRIQFTTGEKPYHTTHANPWWWPEPSSSPPHATILVAAYSNRASPFRQRAYCQDGRWQSRDP